MTTLAGRQARGAELLGKAERYEVSDRLCYVRGPEGITVMLAEQIVPTLGRWTAVAWTTPWPFSICGAWRRW